VVEFLDESNSDFYYLFGKILPGFHHPSSGFNMTLITNILNDFQIEADQRPLFWEKINIVILKIKEIQNG